MASLTGTLSGFFGAEYDRFMTGLSDLAGEDREKKIKALARSNIRPDTPKEVAIPAWDDVIHIAPRLPITADQMDVWRGAQRFGIKPNLPPEVVHEIERRQARLDRMQRAPQPEYAKAYGSMMTALDNVQDFVASVAVLGQLALKAGPWLGGIAGRAGSPALRRIAFAAATPFLIAVPGLGPIFAAAVALNKIMFIGQLLLPAFVAICQGPREALAAGVATGLMKAVFKHAIHIAARMDPRGMRWLGGSKARVAQNVANIGKFLVVAQTTDQLFGVGLSLGPIVGGIMDAAYGSEAAQRGEKIRWAPAPHSEEMRERLRQKWQRVPPAEWRDRMTAARVVYAAGQLGGTQQVFSREEHILALAALLPALRVLREDMAGTGWQEWLPDLVRHPWPPPRFVADSVPWWSIPTGRSDSEGLGWPQVGGGDTMVVADLTDEQLGRVAATLPRLFDFRQPDPYNAFIGALVTDITEELWLLLEEDPWLFKQELAPELVALERMGLVNLLPHPGTDLTQFTPFWSEAVQLVENRKHSLSTRDEWVSLFRKHQVDFIFAQPPSTQNLVAAE